MCVFYLLLELLLHPRVFHTHLVVAVVYGTFFTLVRSWCIWLLQRCMVLLHAGEILVHLVVAAVHGTFPRWWDPGAFGCCSGARYFSMLVRSWCIVRLSSCIRAPIKYEDSDTRSFLTFWIYSVKSYYNANPIANNQTGSEQHSALVSQSINSAT